MNEGNLKTTHFGYRDVPVRDKTGLVRDVFESVAGSYDLMNDLMSMGIHRLWKRRAVELSGIRRGHRVLDLAAGTGDLAARFGGLVGPGGEVVLSDINAAMLEQGRRRMADAGLVGNIFYAQADAQHLPFPDRHFDCVTIGFGLRNVTDKRLALESILRVLKPGGRLLVLEFSKPSNRIFGAVYGWYFRNILPRIGQLVARNREAAYEYLPASVSEFPNGQTLADIMESCGLADVRWKPLTFGIATIYYGTRPGG